jgi:parvulin-like peptidyl-prolyl isomerase
MSGASMTDLRKEMARALTVQKAWKQTVSDTCRASDADVTAFYRENPARFVMPEQVHLFTITVGVPPSGARKDWQDARKTIDGLLAQIRAGAAFEAIARAHSTDPSKDKGGDMGWIHRGRMADEFETVTKGMKPGQVSDPVETLYGYHLVKVAEIKPPEQRTLEQVRPQLTKDLTAKRCETAGEAWVSGLRRKATIVVHDPALAAAAQDPPATAK